MKRRTLAFGGLVAVAVGVAVALGVMRPRAPQATPAAASAEVRVELAEGDVSRAEVMDLSQALPVSGSLRAVNSAMVKARVAGELQALGVREGDPVRAGDVIGQIDPTEYQARLQQAREQADAARAQVDIAQRQYDNNRALVDQGFISRTALESSASSLQAAQATHKAALAAAEVARKSREDAVLRSPIAGVVSQRLAQPGERLPVDARVVEVVDPTRLELEVAVTAAESTRVQAGQAATLQVEGLAEPVRATVARINPAATTGTRTVLVYLSVSSARGLRQGMFAQGTLATGRSQALAVPLSAVRTDKPEPYVQVVTGDRIAHRPVQTGERGLRGGETMVAVRGLEAGVQVVLGHVGALREGTVVAFTQAGAKRAAP